ncbi:MAG: 1-acyl-sn-glycerol-3-phosphate acyltransferase [Acidobacteria bacterium]|nr:MAG: 1-acyl-sn-glycerol-3-phosphate acyltransferase [Acidobacteriota bacterium]
MIDGLRQLLTTVAGSVSGNLALVLATVACGLPGTLLGRLPPRGHWSYLCMRAWARAVLWGSLVRLRVRYEAPLEAARPCVYMANHQSLYDIPALLLTLPGEPRFLAKRGLFRIPLFGWAMAAAGFVAVDRRDRSTARDTFRRARRCLAEGHSVLVFPEETRSPDGRLLPFKPGGFLLALRGAHPIVPVGIRGSGRVRARASLIIRPRPIEVRYGRPIEVAGHGVRDRPALEETVRRRIAELAGVD